VSGFRWDQFNTGDFGEGLAYRLDFSPVAIYTMATVYVSRLCTFIRLAWVFAVFRFEIGQVSDNALCFLNMWEAKQKRKLHHALNRSNVVGTGELVAQPERINRS
jgi:hypothetical protein